MVPSFEFPSSFVLRNICYITGSAFELRKSPHQEQTNQAVLQWFKRFRIYNEEKTQRWLRLGRFDTLAAFSFPDAKLSHLETCLAFFLWGFSDDDLCDEGRELRSDPDEVDYGHEASCRILNDPEAPQPDCPYAAMLWDVLRRVRSTSTEGNYRRLVHACLVFITSEAQQASNRKLDRLPPVQEFILMRRCTVGAAMVEAMVEYSLDIDLPDYVFKDPIVIAMSHAAADMLILPNDLCSFNKEQADGDYQNLVCVVQHAYKLDLQGGVDMLIAMTHDRVKDWMDLKQRLPSFGPEVDAELNRYHLGIENFIQGCTVWNYSSPRYFRDLDPLGKEQVVIELFPKASVEDV